MKRPKCFKPQWLLALALGVTSEVGFAVEGGFPAYLPGSRESLSGIVPPAGTYVGIDAVTLSGDITGVSLAGLPIRANTDLDLNLFKLGITQSFKGSLWGGTPAINLNVPYVADVEIEFTGVLPPIEGVEVRDSTSGVGDIAITPMVGWQRDRFYYSAAMTLFAPTGSYSPATVSLNPPNVSVLNVGKDVWSLQPVLAMTYLNTDNGREFSNAASLLFTEKHDVTEYETAPAFTLESALMQHLPSGLAVGLSGYWYQQLDDDSGAGADRTRAAIGADSLEARSFALGPLISYRGKLAGRETSFKLKYYSEFDSKRKFESDVLWLNATMNF